MPVLGKCTACAEDALPNAEGDAYVHPNLGVLLCERCYERDTRVFEKDRCVHNSFARHRSRCCVGQDDGYEMQCRWCGMGGDLVGCDRCIVSYCEGCIERNLGKKHLEEVKQNEDWSCYSCDSTPTISIRWDNKKCDKVRTRLSHDNICETKICSQHGLAGKVTKKKSRGRATKKVVKTKSAQAKGDQAQTAAIEETDSQEVVQAASGEPTGQPGSESVGKPTTQVQETMREPQMDSASIKKMKVAELRTELSARGLSTKGKKDILIKRLVEATVNRPDQPASATDSQVSTEQPNGDDTNITKQEAPSASDLQEVTEQKDCEEQTAIDAAAIPSCSMSKGDRVKVFSESANAWLSGVVEETNDDGEAHVRYKAGSGDRLKWVDMRDEEQVVRDEKAVLATTNDGCVSNASEEVQTASAPEAQVATDQNDDDTTVAEPNMLSESDSQTTAAMNSPHESPVSCTTSEPESAMVTASAPEAQVATDQNDDDTTVAEPNMLSESDSQTTAAMNSPHESPVSCTTSEPESAVVSASPRRLHSTPKRPAPEKQEQLSDDSPIELMSIGTQEAIAMDGRPSGLISPSQIGKAIESHKTQPNAQSGGSRKRNLDALESELDAEVDSRCKMMVNNARAHGDALRTKFKSQLFLLRSEVRKMTLRDFAEAYGIELNAEIMTIIRQRLVAEGWVEPQNDAAGNGIRATTNQKTNAAMPPPQSIPTATAAASKENLPPQRPQCMARQQVVPNTPMGLKTPAFDPRLPPTPATARCPRRGESLMSANGSPVAVFGGARATFGVHDGTDGVNAGPQIQVALQRGGEVDLSDAQSVAGLGAEAREEARGQLEAMQDQLRELLQTLAA